MNFQKDFDTLFQDILIDWQNQHPDADISEGSIIFMKSACLASAAWGLYKYQEWISLQIFPDTADTAYLEHHAWVRGITRTAGETDAAYLARLLDYIRRPPAGGNKFDYVKWAKEISGVTKAYCVPIGQGLGTVDVIILANVTTTGSEIPSSSARIGVTTSVAANKLIDSGATFQTAHAVAIGDVVENPLRQTQALVTGVDSTTQLALDADLFLFAGDPYIVHCQTGTNTSVTAGKLIDSAGIFDNATYTIKPGDIVKNVTDNLQTTVVTIDSATQLTLASDIFTVTGKKYVIQGLIGQVKAYIDPLRPVTASKVTILPPTIVEEDVTMTVTGTGLDATAIAAGITAYINTMIPGQTLYMAKLITLAMEAGADNATLTTPAADVTATAYEMIRPGTISVS